MREEAMSEIEKQDLPMQRGADPYF
jgi:hypothetical protein